MPIYDFKCKKCGKVSEMLVLPGKDCRDVSCPDCGSDLNREECKCRRQKVDPRLEVLRGLLGSSD